MYKKKLKEETDDFIGGMHKVYYIGDFLTVSPS